MRKFSTSFLGLALLGTTAFAQAPARNCSTMEVLAEQVKADPSMAVRMQNIERHTAAYTNAAANARTGGTASTSAIVTIPVVVHVVYKTAAQNVPTSQIQAQIDVLNRDFAKTNADAGLVPSHFAGVAAATQIQFCLATIDPSGNPTTGIIRKSTTKTSFSSNNGVKYTAQGGSNAWPASQYLNIWLCNLGQGLLGYAQFPGGAAATDGVVCLYSSVPGGTATSYNKGRTMTHEVGHWLNLRHIWGDATCGNDFVADTPLHNTSNGGCPTSTHRSTCTGTPLEQWMNYMDYTYDACMYMFSAGQAARMEACVAPGGPRASLATSGKCGAAIAANTSGDASRSFNAETAVFPNPVTSEMTLRYVLDADQSDVNIIIHNMLGQVVKQYNVGSKSAGTHNLSINALSDMQNAANGMYTCTITGSEKSQVVRFMLNK